MEIFKRADKKEKGIGWTLDYKLIETISDMTKDTEFEVGMEDTESVLLATEKYFLTQEPCEYCKRAREECSFETYDVNENNKTVVIKNQAKCCPACGNRL